MGVPKGNNVQFVGGKVSHIPAKSSILNDDSVT